ncbi:HNH endonuclease [Escherichia coli]|uniref:HNH endonuclease signature motif containing protein n=1 Tax=Escherichia coli TaxID=562 RepID=UPI001483BFAA|nr:HNH endonuclease signature motif containing protein [Escherichia coli]NNR90766.1 HNH endonuclease [Escherichia coli]NNR90821.1 HNH endonuclease [Escherichia coli]
MSMELNEYFEYRDGSLVWKARSPEFFNNKKNRNYHNVWNAKHAGKVAGLLESNGYIRIRINGIKWLAHRIVWVMFNGDIPEGMEIDHINGIRHDNRIENLRLVKKSANQRNRIKLSKNNSSGISGVYFCNTRKRWIAHKRLLNARVQKVCSSFEEAKEVIRKFDEENNITISK